MFSFVADPARTDWRSTRKSSPNRSGDRPLAVDTRTPTRRSRQARHAQRLSRFLAQTSRLTRPTAVRSAGSARRFASTVGAEGPLRSTPRPHGQPGSARTSGRCPLIASSNGHGCDCPGTPAPAVARMDVRSPQQRLTYGGRRWGANLTPSSTSTVARLGSSRGPLTALAVLDVHATGRWSRMVSVGVPPAKCSSPGPGRAQRRRLATPVESGGRKRSHRAGRSSTRMTGRLGYVRPISVKPAATKVRMVPVKSAEPLTRSAFSASVSTGWPSTAVAP